MKPIVTRRVDGQDYVAASDVGPLLNEIEDLTILRDAIQEKLEDIEARLLGVYNSMVPGNGPFQVPYKFTMGKVAARLLNCIEDLGELIET